VLAELAAVIPAFAVGKDGHLPVFGAPIAGASDKPGAAGVPFSDAWTLHRGAQIYASASDGQGS
jgi:hypothetical protein